MTLENPKSDFGNWFNEVIFKGQIVDYRTPVKGANVLMPNGYDIWERIKYLLDMKLKKDGVRNAYFPMFIPKSFLEKEAEHFQGFVPEVIYATRVGEKELEEQYAIRPTSETIMYYMYALWVKEKANLPIKINQFNNVVRWDTKHTKPLLRDREFLWSETHTCHATYEEADEQVKNSLKVYSALFDELCLPYIIFKRPENDKFPGAVYSLAYDCPMPDGRVLQIGTTHHLGDNFSKVFEIKFQDEKMQFKYAHQTSYGISTRLIGAIVAVHGDDKGLIIPPLLAPIQVVVIPIIFKKGKQKIIEEARAVTKTLEEADIRVHLDDRDQYSAGWKFNEYEIQGVPIRLEIGPKDIEKQQVTTVRRDTGEKIIIKKNNLIEDVKKILDAITDELKRRGKELLESKMTTANSIDEVKEIFEKGKMIIQIDWCGEIECAEKLREETGAKLRGTKYDIEEPATGNCIVCGNEGKVKAYIADAY